VHGTAALLDGREPVAQLFVALGGLGEREFVGGRLKSGIEESGVVAIA
jgi:hypothetical protein